MAAGHATTLEPETSAERLSPTDAPRIEATNQTAHPRGGKAPVGGGETPVGGGETPVGGGETPVGGGETPVGGGETPQCGGRRGLLAASFVYLLGNVAQRGAAYLLIPLYLRILSPEEVGQWGLLQAMQTVLLIVMDLGVSKAVTRFYFDYDDKAERRDFLAAMFLCRVGLSALLAMVGWSCCASLWAVATHNALPFAPFAPVLLAAVAAETVNLLISSVYRVEERPGAFVALRLGQALLQIVCSAALVLYFSQGVLGALVGQAMGASVVGLFATAAFFIQCGVPKCWPGNQIAASFRYSLPLIPHELAWWGRNMADPLILIHYITPAALGVYNVGYLPGSILGVAAGSVDLAYGPYFYRVMKQNAPAGRAHVALAAQAMQMIAAAGVLAAGMSLSAPYVLHAICGDRYAGAERIAAIVLAAYFFHSQYLCYVKPLFYRKRTALIPWLTVLPSALGAAGTALLVPSFGMETAAWSTLVTFVAIASLVYAMAQRTERFPYAPFLLGTYSLSVVLIAIGVPALLNRLETMQTPGLLNVGPRLLVVDLSVRLIAMACCVLFAWRLARVAPQLSSNLIDTTNDEPARCAASTLATD